MNGYKRVKNVSKARSRSMDLSDLPFQSRTSKPVSNHSFNLPNSNSISYGKGIPEKSKAEFHSPTQENENGEIFGVILNRKWSSSVRYSTSPHHHNYYSMSDEKENASSSSSSSSLGSSVIKRVLSMKRSSSVSEGYSRILHQSDPTYADDDDAGGAKFEKKSTEKKGKILRACRRIFRF